MEGRYKKLADARAQNSADFNKAAQKNKMPYIVVVIDELADLMCVAKKKTEAAIQRIAQKARAVGIYLIVATQRLDASVISGIIKANFPTRISFQASSPRDSMTTLGERGAETLLSRGDMLYSDAGRMPARIHSAFISDKEIKSIAKFLQSQGTPKYVDM